MITINNDSKLQTILITKDFTINNIRDILQVIKKDIHFELDIKVKVIEISAFDITAIQLLYAIKKTAINKNNSITFNIQLPRDTVQLLKNAGFSDDEIKIAP